MFMQKSALRSTQLSELLQSEVIPVMSTHTGEEEQFSTPQTPPRFPIPFRSLPLPPVITILTYNIID